MYKSEVYGKGGMYAKVVADSIANGVRLTTLELRYPRFIHSEFMTHRMFSRNASSSRAIPVAKMIEQVEKDPAMPIHWGKNQKGMQAKDEIDDISTAEDFWICAADSAILEARDMVEKLQLHKQIVNRILEPFQFIKVVVTATEWDNFFKLRLDDAAQPEIMELARCMKEAMDGSFAMPLKPGEYHLPYINASHWRRYHAQGGEALERAIKASVARCARVSYMNHDKTYPTLDKDIALHDQLLEAGHMSPFEHVATPMRGSLAEDWFIEPGVTHPSKDEDGFPYWSGNFRGFIQYRQLVQ